MVIDREKLEAWRNGFDIATDAVEIAGQFKKSPVLVQMALVLAHTRDDFEAKFVRLHEEHPTEEKADD